MSARASPIPALFSLRIPSHSVSLEQHQTINNFSPQLGCVFGLLLSSSSGGFHSVCSPTARLHWRFWPPAWCLPSRTHPTVAFSRSRHALLLSYFTVLALCSLRGLHYRHPLNASLPLVFQVFAPKSSLGWCHVLPTGLSSSVL